MITTVNVDQLFECMSVLNMLINPSSSGDIRSRPEGVRTPAGSAGCRARHTGLPRARIHLRALPEVQHRK